ncbi:hypothetical protein [Alteromonas sp. P256]|uniref:hypothetical protein n=1 Tax=Alteromonas sp. P256 TaxID=3117399 RepID=UPI002FE2B82C
MTLKLDIEVLAKDDDEALSLLTRFAHEKLLAADVHELDGTKTLNIDGGENDIRAKISNATIEFWVRYSHDESMYEKKLLDFCRQHNLTVRFKTTDRGDK